jgi:hypothetical protein
VLSHSPDQPTGQVDRIRATARTLVADVSTDHTGALTGTAESVVSAGVAGVPGSPGKAGTARRWNELVHSYSAPGTDNLLYRVPDRIQRPLGPTARRERARIDALMRRQALVTASIAAGTLGAVGGATIADAPAFALAAGLAATVTGVVSFALWWRLGDRRTALTATDAHNTWQMTRFSRWLVARAHQATVRATEANGGPADTANRMAESLYQFTGDVRTLERIIGSSSTVADTYGRVRQVRGHRDHVDTLLDAQAHTLRALDLFESTAREVVLAAHAEHAAGERAGVVSSLLDLQAEALTRREALAALDDPHLPEPLPTNAPS